MIKMKKLPKSWGWKELKEIIKKDKFAIVDGPFGTQLHRSDYTAEGVPLIRIKNITKENTFDFNDLVYISEEKFEELKRSSAYKEDILLAKTGATIGKVCLFPKELKKCLIASSCAKISVDKFKVIPKYILSYLSTVEGQRQIINLSGGSTRNSINLKPLSKVKIPIPFPDNPEKSLAIQKKIVEILDKAEKLKTRRADANAETNKILQSVFLEMFGDPVKNEKDWEIKKLREVCEINPKKGEISELNDNTEITFLPMASVSEEGKIFNKEIKKLGEVKKGFTYFREKDVLFAKITPCMENGKRAIATELKNGIGFGTTEFHVLRAKENINPYWVFGLISLEKFRKIAEINMTGTAGQKRVPTDFLKNFRVPIPPLTLQYQFAEIVEKVEKIKERQKDSTKEINDLFNSLMQKAFKGELD